ncbi:MAG: retroviral-like aspartic protease family protein [Firmicutes bacterium]|nr:retroviral-like aspartic protease family protein [Bacillota bacterium]
MKIECHLFSPNKATFREIMLLIDTGASRTAISRKQLQALKYTNIVKDPTPK